MAFDKPTRNRLSSFVAEARRLVAEEFMLQFQSLYGISVKGAIAPLEQLGHLDDIGLATAALLRERIDYLVKTHPDDREGINAAVTRLAREQAFTVLNRLAAIRMAEKRGLIVESVGKGYQSKGFKVFEQVAGSGLGDTYHRYCRYIFCLFDELAVDLGVLFDRRSPQGLLFPRETALLALLAILNASDLDSLWTEDETIGWIYQYYNDPAERKKMRDESAAPRNSRELAVRNQLFTPRYVVEFLTDNTLGRIWYEMMKGKTRLTDQCRYLVRRPTEIFLKPGEIVPEILPQEDLSQEELLKQPVYIPHRPLKDPREIGLLDPACGSMHFGLYAFDLFEAIYEEAWDLGLKSLRIDYPEKEVFLRELPRLIIEHNIHGIDIDPRATQIAGLSLWLRAQKSWQAQHIPAAQRPRIMRSNIVCAEPMPGSPEMLREFTATLHPPLLGQLVEKVFARMQLAGEAGSLLKIEEEITTLVKDAKKLWQAGPKAEQTELSLGLEAKPKQGEFPLDVSGISDERFWETAEERIYAALRAYAEQAENGGSFQRRLFAEDAVQGFAFIDVCRKRYDVVLMNPPFGEYPIRVLDLAKKHYPQGWIDIYCCFMMRAAAQLTNKGSCGCITSRAFMFLRRLSRFRSDVLLRCLKPSLVLDLGMGVMDSAAVEACASILLRDNNQSTTLFIDALSDDTKHDIVATGLYKWPALPIQWRIVVHSNFSLLPDSVFTYKLDDAIIRLFRNNNQFNTIAKASPGLTTLDNERFIRLHWEVRVGDCNWVPFAKGGSGPQFYQDMALVLLWERNGSQLKERAAMYGGAPSRFIASEENYFKPGLTYPRVGRYFSVRFLPKGCIFAEKGISIFLNNDRHIPEKHVYDRLLFLASLLNSRLASYLVSLNSPGRFWESGSVNRIPIPHRVESSLLTEVALRAYQVSRNNFLSIETSRLFCTINTYGDSVVSIQNVMAECDQEAANLYGIHSSFTEDIGHSEDSTEEGEPDDEVDGGIIYSQGIKSQLSHTIGCIFGRWDIRYATGERQPPELPDPFAPLPVCPPCMLQNADGLPAEPKDLPANYPLRISWPGILVDDENHPEDIVAHVREAFEVIWKDRADAIEHEACELLGVKTLRDYFRRPAGFFADHLKRYSKSRRQAPIYWPLSTSKGSYTLWIYYHRLTDQTLHTALADFIDPKLKTVRAEISALRESANHRIRLEELLDLEKELVDFHTEIEGIIKLPWKPNLNDGVLITASPLWKLFRLPKWQKDLKTCWEKLEKGEYDWAHLAYSIWPKRVEEVCKKDRSIAIAHGLEAICQTENPKPKKKGNRK